MEQHLREYYRALLSKRNDSLAMESQRKLQEADTRAGRTGLTGSGMHLAGLIGLHVEWRVRQPMLGMIECYEEACQEVSAAPTVQDYEEIQREAQNLVQQRLEQANRFAQERLSRHGSPPGLSSLAEQAVRRVIAEFDREVELKLIKARSKMKTPATCSNRVFVVHGHNHTRRDEVAAFLKSIDLRPIILDAEPAKGRTLIEKLEQEGDVNFAVVLLTGDDLGTEQNRPSDLRPRARQNVILELGYFVGRHGRAKVVPLYEAGVEIPADYRGVEYISLSSDWQSRLVAELKAAGLPVNVLTED